MSVYFVKYSIADFYRKCSLSMAWDIHYNFRAQGYKTFFCSTQLSMTFFLLINIKMPTIVGILTFMSGKSSISGLSEHYKC